MIALVKESTSLDKRAMNLGLDEALLMENAGLNLALFIKKICKKRFKKKTKARVLFLLGGGNNASDCLVAARTLKNAFLFELSSKHNANYEKQRELALNLRLHFLEKKPKFQSFDVIVDGLFGSGFKGELSLEYQELFKEVEQSRALKIACDIPSGLGSKGAFKADFTLCMGAIKEALLEDSVKEKVGRIKVLNLGLLKSKFLPHKLANSFLLEKKDLKLIQKTPNSNKGDFGHVFVLANKSAGSITSLAALNFGAGLVSLVGSEAFSPLIMTKPSLSEQAKAVALGMGLEDLSILEHPLLENLPLVIDANCFSSPKVLDFLQRSDVVLTPHPKEFARLWKMAFQKDLSVEELQSKRFFYAREFSHRFACVLLLKGANPIITQDDKLFVVNLGTPALAKAGSGDALSGMIAALLANEFSALAAAKNASLAHALVAQKYKYNPNSFDALRLIKDLKCL